MKKFAILKIIISLALVLVLFAGCKDNSKSSGDSAKEDTPTLVWYQIGNPPTDLKAGVENINKYIVDKIGAKIDIKYYTWGEYEEKINNVLNTGEDFDIMFAHTTYFTGHAAQGKFLKLNDKLASVTPSLNSFVQKELWKGVTIDGNIYGVPTAKDSAATQYFAFDKDIVAKYDIDIASIKSYKDLEPVLVKIKEGEEKATGQKVYPFYLNLEGNTTWKTNYDNYVKWDDSTATAKNTFERPEMLEHFELLHSWFEKGLINPDASTLAAKPKHRLVFAEQAFPGAEVNWEAEFGYKIVATPFTTPIISNETIIGSVNVISANSKNQDKSLKFLELANTDNTLRNMIAYGVEGTHFTKNDNGTITKIGENYNTATYCQASTYTLSPISPNEPNQYKLVEDMTKNADSHVLLGFSFDNKKVSTQIANVNATIKKYEAELYTGAYKGTTADYLDKFNKELKSAGMDEILAETQTQINAFLGK